MVGEISGRYYPDGTVDTSHCYSVRLVYSVIEGAIRQGPLWSCMLCLRTEYSVQSRVLLYRVVVVVALASTWPLLAITNQGARAWLLLALLSCTDLTMHPCSRLKVKPIKTAVSLYPTQAVLILPPFHLQLSGQSG